MNKDFSDNLPSEEQLLSDLRRHFPKMRVRPLRAYGVKGSTYGAWVGGESDCVMPDGLPIFDEMGTYADDETRDSYVHSQFEKWLYERGWHIQLYDYGVYFIEPVIFLDGFCMLQDREYHVGQNIKRNAFNASRANVLYMSDYRTKPITLDCPF
jgi:hypothetical protein